MENFENIKAILDKIKCEFKCVMCCNVKNEDSIVFYWTCEHIFCMDCIEKGKACVICEASEGLHTVGKQITLKENDAVLSIFRSVINNDISALIMGNTNVKDVSTCKVPKNRNSKKQLKLNSEENGIDQKISANNEKSESQKKNKKLINVTKRNYKGETPLHLACRKRDLSLMQELINAGANPNVQDNAGWTPLHDAIAFKEMELIKFLLDNGARVNTPGHENKTPLHQSVMQGNENITRLLLRYGADKSARNIYGETPLDIIKKYDIKGMEEIMANTPAKFKSQSKILTDSLPTDAKIDMVLYGSELNDNDKVEFGSFINQFKFKTVDNVSPHRPPSHFIVSEKEEPKVTWNIIVGVLLACRVISIKWIKDSIEKNSIQPVEKYEVASDFYMGFSRSKQNQINQLPGLFSGCHFYLGGNTDSYKTKTCSFLKGELKLLVEKNGGVTVSRSPDPESLALEKTIPYHADVNGSLSKTSYYIIYSKNSWDPALKYNMTHMKTLPVEWLLASILKFELIDPNIDQSYMEDI